MASKRFQRSVSALILTAVLLSGCQAGAQKKGKDGSGGNAVTDGSTSDINNTSSDTLTSGTSEETPANTPTPAFTPTPTLSPAPKYENNSTNVDGHHEFRPHVFSTVYQNEFGGKTKEALYAYIDAVRNGDDTFPCPDENTYRWVIGHLASHFCPVGDYFVDETLATGPLYENGTGYIYYTIPKDTFCLGVYGDETWKHMTFSATDNRYEELWGISHGGGAMYVGMDRENKDVICEDYSGYTFTFHYGK
ncbi:MAG: hypothetical protein IKH92_04780 [Clostridiales bacterium]|nr:hypothetical protein [Clostridiales bacterium]